MIGINNVASASAELVASASAELVASASAELVASDLSELVASDLSELVLTDLSVFFSIKQLLKNTTAFHRNPFGKSRLNGFG